MYDSVDKESPYFPLAARVAALGAINGGYVWLLDRVRSDMAKYLKGKRSAKERLAMTLIEAIIRARLRLPDGYPKWLEDFDFRDVPHEWYPLASFLAVKVAMEQGRFEAARAAAGMAIAVNDLHDRIEYAGVWMRLMYAIACRETQRHEEMEKWFREAAKMASANTIIVPFLEYAMGDGSSLETALMEVSPSLADNVDARVDQYFLMTIKMRNHLTGSHLTNKLSRRYFFVARHLNSGYSYKEIAGMMGVSVGRLRNIVMDIYTKLNIHSSEELQGLVW